MMNDKILDFRLCGNDVKWRFKMKKFLFLLLAVMVLAAYGCGGGGTDTVEVPGETVTVTTPGDIITVNNNIPVANAGADQTSAVGNIVSLDGTGSSDADGDAFTCKWTIVSVPSGSSLNALGDAATAAPYFGVDVAGNYTLQLIVNDGKAD
ncbi:hypothetical protein HY798_04495, partial [Candidatus Falkowbacteria bacterium]|nr:hypothetical protein [Candidatus Falkowbacteria bacterium]